MQHIVLLYNANNLSDYLEYTCLSPLPNDVIRANNYVLNKNPKPAHHFEGPYTLPLIFDIFLDSELTTRLLLMLNK